MRLDRCKNFVASSHDAAPKNFVFDSHWQQSRSIRLKCTGAKKLAVNFHIRLQRTCGVRDVVAKVLVFACRIREVQMEIQLGMESH